MGDFNTNIPRQLNVWNESRVVRPAPVDKLVSAIERYLIEVAVLGTTATQEVQQPDTKVELPDIADDPSNRWSKRNGYH